MLTPTNSDITFIGSFGDHDKTVVLSKLLGGYYHIYADRLYYGQVHLRKGKWTVLLQNTDTMDADDMQVISDLIKEHEDKH
jgi:hypothetical protein